MLYEYVDTDSKERGASKFQQTRDNEQTVEQFTRGAFLVDEVCCPSQIQNEETEPVEHFSSEYVDEKMYF